VPAAPSTDNSHSLVEERQKQGLTSSESPTVRALRKLFRHKTAMFGLSLLALIVAAILAAPVLAPYNPAAYNPGAAMKPPSVNYVLGTDHIGRDVLSRILWGGRMSLQVGCYAVVIATLGGIAFGTTSGYFGGAVDEVAMRFMDIWLAFPGLLLSLAVVIVLGAGMLNLTIAIGISGIPRFSRIIRGSVLSAKENLYVEAARAQGASDLLIIARHILPNIIAPFLVYAMLSEGRDFMRRAWWLTTFPGLAIMLTVISVNLVGDGLRDVLDPRLD